MSDLLGSIINGLCTGFGSALGIWLATRHFIKPIEKKIDYDTTKMVEVK